MKNCFIMFDNVPDEVMPLYCKVKNKGGRFGNDEENYRILDCYFTESSLMLVIEVDDEFEHEYMDLHFNGEGCENSITE